MAAQISAKVIRIQNIDKNTSPEQLEGLLKQSCSDNEKTDIEIKVSLVPSCTVRDGSQSALIKIRPTLPQFLQNLGKSDYQIKSDSSVLNLDKNFFGLTQLYSTSDGGVVTADLVAVTGLNGRPFDSWRGKGPHGLMWLKDFLCLDLPSFRTMIYGYNTKWDSKSVADISDFTQDFIEELRKARQSNEEMERPLILVAHSLGAIIAASALKQCKLAEPKGFSRATYRAVRAVLLFGAPHQGMQVEDIAEMATELGAQERMHLVNFLRKGSEPLQRHLSSLTSLAGDFRIISFYETVLSRKLVKAEAGRLHRRRKCVCLFLQGSEKGYERAGEYYEYLSKSSATLNLPSNLEERIPVDSDHSSMVKFDHRSDRTYQNILLCLRNIEAHLPTCGFESVLDWPEFEKTRYSSKLGVSAADLESKLVEIAGLYKRLSFDISAEQVKVFAGLRIEFQFGCQKAKQYIELLREQLSSAHTEPQLEKNSDLLTRYHLILERSVFTLRKLVGWGPFLKVSDRAEDTKTSLVSCITALSHLNSEAAAIVNPDFVYLFRAPGQPNELEPQVQTIANMTIARGSVLEHDLNELWVDSKALVIGDFPEPRIAVPSRNLLQRLVKFWSGNEIEKLKLTPRQYGILKIHGGLEDIVAEFRPYPQNLKTIDPDEYHRQRLQVSQLARMLLSARSSKPSTSFPCLSLRCISEIANPSNPAFILVFSSRGIESLGEVIHQYHRNGSHPPPTRVRQQLALGLAKAVLALHLSGQVHGGINPENIFLRVGHISGDTVADWEALTTPLLAGFEIAREMTGQTDLIDVEDPHLRVYLHPRRHPESTQKSKQTQRFDIFSLGMVLIEIGLWKRFQYLQKYQEARDDHQRQSFAKRLRKSFSHSTTGEEATMGRLYEAIVTYCLADEPEISEAEPNSIPDQSSVFLGSPNGMQLVALLEQQLR